MHSKRPYKILICPVALRGTEVFSKLQGLKGAVSQNSANLRNYKMPVKLRETYK